MEPGAGAERRFRRRGSQLGVWDQHRCVVLIGPARSRRSPGSPFTPGGSSSTGPDDSIQEAVARAVGALDRDAIRARFRAQDECVWIERFLPDSAIARLIADAERVRPAIHRSYIPRHKKGGSVGAHTLRTAAPAVIGLYRAPAVLDFLASLAGRPLRPCPDRDPHACALYYYTEPGDHIAGHYDTSYYRGARYTVLLGVVNRTQSRLVGQLHRRDPGRAPVDFSLATEPGTLVAFNGDRLWHAITPLGPGEERISLTMEFVTDARMAPLGRFVSDMKDAIAYFGFRGVFGRRPRVPFRDRSP